MDVFIKLWIHDGRVYQMPHYVQRENVESVISDWRKQVISVAKEANADHFVYCTKSYDKDDQLTDLNFYATPLTDEQFYERTGLLTKEKNVKVLAWHKGTAY